MYHTPIDFLNPYIRSPTFHTVPEYSTIKKTAVKFLEKKEEKKKSRVDLLRWLRVHGIA